MVASGIRNRHETDKSNRLSYGNILLSVYKSCLEGEHPSQDTVQHLANWLEVGASRRGLEKMSQKEMYRQRRKTVSNAILTVLDTQNIFKDDSFDARADHLRVAYQKITAPGILFARVIAVADELAARQDSKGNCREDERRGDPHRKNLHSMNQWHAKRCCLSADRLSTVPGLRSEA